MRWLIPAVILLAVATRKKSKWPLSVFDSPDAPGSGRNMDKALLSKLALAETYVQKYYPDFKFKFNSAYRTAAQNKKADGVDNSPHKYGYAVDIHAPKNMQKPIAWALRKAGIIRIGIGNTFVHADTAPAPKWPQVTWGYPTPGTRAPFDVAALTPLNFTA